MIIKILFPVVYLLVALFSFGLVSPVSASTTSGNVPDSRYSVLVFSKTDGFRHSSIASGVAAVQKLGRKHNFSVDASEEASVFTEDNLAGYKAVIFLNTTENILNERQQNAFERYIQEGGGFVGIHAAADTEYEWEWYGRLVGAYFKSHPKVQKATVRVADRVHPSTKHLPARWEHRDEWYNYNVNPRGQVHVLATVDEESYENGEMGHDHPIAWAHEFDGGRAWYTGLGHTKEAFSEEAYLKHLLGGIEWAAGQVTADVGATVEGSFEKEVLVDNLTDPMEIDIAPDGRIFFLEREGSVRIWDPATESTHTAGLVPVATVAEDGMLGITLDPNFTDNGWVYLYYSAAGEEARNVLSRFTVADGKLQMDSQKLLLEVPTQRRECCHTGGSLKFGPNGNLFISTGDNTNPFASSGFAPIDEREDRKPWDAQRSSANTMDLRGKILRIRPLPDGSYEIPEGNLFSEGENGRPEIFTMGHRNPYRISVDPKNGWLYWGEVGPDAGAPNDQRGPAGHDELNRAKEAGNYGWPYFVGNNKPYREYSFTKEESGDYFNPERPINKSVNNTGARVLPPAQTPLIWYPYGPSEEFPALSAGGRCAMAGPIHYHDESVSSEGLPAYYNRTLFFYEWARNYIKEVKFDKHGNIVKINPFVPEMEFVRPMEMELGPDGRLYIVEWGDNFGGENRNAQIVRLNYQGAGGAAPRPVASVDKRFGDVPLKAHFNASDSYSKTGEMLSYAWDFDGDGVKDAKGPQAFYTYKEPGQYTAELTVVDGQGRMAREELLIMAGNSKPAVSIKYPVEGGFYEPNKPIDYRVSVTDREDASIEEAQLTVQPLLKRNTHTRPLPEQKGPSGSFSFRANDLDQRYIFNRAGILEARYTDRGNWGAKALTGLDRVVLQPKQKEAEHYSSTYGVSEARVEDNEKRFRVLDVEAGNYVAYTPVNLLNIEAISFRAARGAGGTIEVRLDSPDGLLLGEAEVPAAEKVVIAAKDGGEEQEAPPVEWTDVTVPVDNPGGTHTLFLVFKGPQGKSLFKLDRMVFKGTGVMK